MSNLKAEVFKAVVADVITDHSKKTPDEIAEKMHRRFSGLDSKRMIISRLEEVKPGIEIVQK